jgi:putative spermidine/putrescine transport system permease protein
VAAARVPSSPPVSPVWVLESVVGWLLKAINVFVYLYLVAPIVIVVLVSFTPSTYIAFPPQGWSLRWYEEMLVKTEFIESLWLSLWLGIFTASIATALGTLCSFALVRFRFPGRDLVSTLVLSPLLLPGIVTGVALLQFMAIIGMGPSLGRLLLAHVLITTPYVVRAVTATLAGFDRSLEEAAMSLGANRWKTTRMITVPLIKSGLMAGAIFAFIISFDNVIVSIFLSTAEFTPLPIRIYQYVEFSAKPVVAAISTLQILVIVGLMLIFERLIGFSKYM